MDPSTSHCMHQGTNLGLKRAQFAVCLMEQHVQQTPFVVLRPVCVCVCVFMCVCTRVRVMCVCVALNHSLRHMSMKI